MFAANAAGTASTPITRKKVFIGLPRFPSLSKPHQEACTTVACRGTWQIHRESNLRSAPRGGCISRAPILRKTYRRNGNHDRVLGEFGEAGFPPTVHWAPAPAPGTDKAPQPARQECRLPAFRGPSLRRPDRGGPTATPSERPSLARPQKCRSKRRNLAEATLQPQLTTTRPRGKRLEAQGTLQASGVRSRRILL